MTDPRRLLEGSMTGISQQLLRSAEGDEPAAERVETWRRQLGLPLAAAAAAATATLVGAAHASAAGAVPVAASSATAAANVGAAASLGGLKSVGWVVAVKWTGVVLLPVALGATVLASRAPTPVGLQPPAAAQAPASAKVRASTASPAKRLNEPEPELGSSPEVGAPRSLPMMGQASRASRAPAEAPSSQATESLGTAPMLERELAQLDAARRALRRGNPTLALIELDRHAQGFPGSRLSDEATVLRISALGRVGRAAEATTLGQAFLRRRPNSPLAASVRAELARKSR